MTLSRLLTLSATPKGIPGDQGIRGAVAVFTAILLAANPTQMLAAQPSLDLDISLKVGPVATQLNITRPVMFGPDGSVPVFRSTLHAHVQDDVRTPPFNADLIAIGEAGDSNKLIGGFLLATIIVEQDLLNGLPFQTAAADAQTKTGVKVTFFQDATMTEYALLLVAVLLLSASAMVVIEPSLSDQACAVKNSLVDGLNTSGLASIVQSYGINLTACQIVIP